MFNIRPILLHLAACERYRPSKHRTAFEETIRMWERRLRNAAFGAIGLVLGLVLWHKFVFALPAAAAPVVIGLAYGCAFCWFLTAFLETGVMFVMRKRWRLVDAEHDIGRVEHMESCARPLLVFDDPHLRYAIDRSKARVSAIEGRLALIWGERVALVSLAALLFGSYKSLSTFQDAATNIVWWHQAAKVVAAGVIGLALGTFMAKALARRYTFHQEILSLAIELRGLGVTAGKSEPSETMATIADVLPDKAVTVAATVMATPATRRSSAE